MFKGMTDEAIADGQEKPVDSTPSQSRFGAWSMGMFIRLVDEAIDSAGAQLARSGGLWDDSVEDRLVRESGRRPRGSVGGVRADDAGFGEQDADRGVSFL
jgi:hypothetical protein